MINHLPFPPTYQEIIEQIPHYRKLSEDDKKKIEHSILYFIYTKSFVGNHIEVTDEMRVVIAFYACLLLLHHNDLACYESLKTIIIYPFAMVTKQVMAHGGIYQKGEFILSGQSAGHTVVISWHDAKKEAYHLRQNNVILHEFAHEIDYMEGEADGVPPLELSKYHEWSHIVFREFDKLANVALTNRDWGKYKLIGEYAATNEIEFFAVITERFFESPRSFKYHFPDLYKELQSFYKIDPIIFEDSAPV